MTKPGRAGSLIRISGRVSTLSCATPPSRATPPLTSQPFREISTSEGGSFDPVHLGHSLVARAAREESGWDKVLFHSGGAIALQTGALPRARAGTVAPVAAGAGRRNGGDMDDLEIRRGGVSYTVDTLRHYAEKFPGAEFFYLIGADQAAQLPQWREAGELARLARICGRAAPGREPRRASRALSRAGLARLSAGGVVLRDPGAGQGGAAGHAPDAGRGGGGDCQ